MQPAVPLGVGAERYRAFSKELGFHAKTHVSVMHGQLQSAPKNGYILFVANGDLSRSLGAVSPVQATRLKARLVLLDNDWKQSLIELERYQLVAAIDSIRVSEWLARPTGCKGPFGLRYLADSIEAKCSPLPWFQTNNYCRLDSNCNRTLPRILADYLDVYNYDQEKEQDRQRLRSRVNVDRGLTGDFGEPNYFDLSTQKEGAYAAV